MKLNVKTLKQIGWAVMGAFVLMNLVAFFHAYRFTHFTSEKVRKTSDPRKLTAIEKMRTLAFGIRNPRPANSRFPSRPFSTLTLHSNRRIECWHIKTDKAKGTVVLFHGFTGEKSSMLDKSDIFLKFGYNTMLVDFMGSGGSEGNQTSIGYLEAQQVKTVFDYLQGAGEKTIFLFGTSMGAVAIMKAMKDYNLHPSGIMLECPFGTMYETVCARFETMDAPVFPMAGLLVFWGGLQNGFWAFAHNPTEYAKSVRCPVLLMYGGRDDKVSREEITEMFTNLGPYKRLKIYPLAGHDNYLAKYSRQWTDDVAAFVSYAASLQMAGSAEAECRRMIRSL